MYAIYVAALGLSGFLVGYQVAHRRHRSGWPTNLDFVVVVGGMIAFVGISLRYFQTR